MKNLRLVPLLVTAALTPACVMDSVQDSSFVLDWTIEDVGPAVDPVTCEEAGVTTVAMTARNFTTGTIHSFNFDCVNYGGQTPILPTGEYGITLQLLRADGVEVSAINRPVPGEAPILISNRRITDLGFTIFEIQSFALDWQVTRTAAPNTPVLCQEVGATQVELEAAIPTDATLAPFVFRWPCTDYRGLTQAVPLGSYILGIRLLDAAGGRLSDLTVPYTTPDNAQAVIPLVTFTVN